MKPAELRRRTSIRGFTLVELLATVVVLGIIAGLASPAFYGLIVNQQVRSASFDLSTAFVYARDEATKRNANVKLSALTSDWAGGWQLLDPAGNVLQAHEALAKVTITTNVTTSTGCATPCVVFNRTGRVVRTAATTVTTDGNPPSFKLINQSGTPGAITRCLGLDPSGRVNTSATSC